MNSMPRPPRLHALDNLRAIMMWLGIVLHVAVIHIVGRSPLPWRDEQRSAGADFLIAFIHAFRMPVFFILAGFFVALLAQGRGPAGMLRHRLRRLALPFAVFWPVLWVATGFAGLAFLNRMATGRWALDESVLPADVPRGPQTMHLWFLWLLIWFSVATAGVLAVRDARIVRGLQRAGAVLALLGARAWGFALLALPLAAVGSLYPDGILVVRGSFLPPAAEWLHHGIFFVFGLALFARQQELFALYQRRWRACAAAGLVFFLAAGGLAQQHGSPWAIAYLYNCATWLWSFAWIGLALRVLEARRPWLAWLADSAYWVYLVHLPLTVIFGALLFGLDLPAWVKIALNISATTAVCLASYAAFVRGRAIGALLNGRRIVMEPVARTA